jgi:gliding motility-associated-like protein
MRNFRSIYSLLLFLLASFGALVAQNNHLKVAFKDAASAPRNLNVCENEATVTVTVSTEGSNTTARRNISAALRLFKGVKFVRLNQANTSAGVSLQSSTATGAVFSLPTLTPNLTSSVDISYVIRVNCDYTDSLSRNDLLDVRDAWDFRYDLNPATGLTETDLSTPYRDQIKVPFFTMSVSNNASPARVGQCYQRKVLINNSGLSGYVSSIEYKNLQGPGIYVTSITVNGQTLPVSRQAVFNATGDTALTIQVPASVFAFNTRGPNDPADGDTQFEPDETVTVIENFCVVSCDRSRQSSHQVSWGCDARFCNTIARTDVIRLGEGQVNVGFAPTGSLPDSVGGYCRIGRSTVRFTNNGVEIDPGTASMYDLQLGVGLGDSVLLRDKGYHITSIRVAGRLLPTPSVALADLRQNPLFATDPDGANVGLADLDGDGFYDDLPVGKSVEITIQYEVECSTSLSNRVDNCTNDFETAFNGQLNYTDLCGRRVEVIKPRYFAPLNVNDFVENCTDPDCFTDQKPFNIQHLERRNIFNFDRSCNGQEEILVRVKVPTGVTAIYDSMYMLRFTDTLFIRRMNRSNDTVFIYFRADSAKQKGNFGQMIKVDYLNGDFKVNMGFKADCQTQPGPTYFPLDLSYICPPCNCQHIWYCDTLDGPRVHYAQPPCPLNAAYDCAKGLRTTAFAAFRTTLGYTDQTYRTKINPSVANRKVAMSCDSVQMMVNNVVGNASLSDSLGIRIQYDKILFNAATQNNDIFNYGSGLVKFVKGGQTFTCAVPASKLRIIRTDSSRFIYVDLHECFTGLGIAPLSRGDSVNFIGNFAVNPEGPFKNTFEKIPRFRAYGYHIDGGQEFACDNFGETYRVGKPQSLFSFPNSSSYPRGCAEANLEYKILILNNGYNDHMGNEYRQAIGVDSFYVQFDTAFIRAFDTKVEVSIPDHPFAGNAFYPLSNLSHSGIYIARFDTLRVVPSLNRVQSFAFNLRIKATPNCRSLTGSSRGNSSFDFKPRIFFRDRYYATEIGDGQCAPFKRDSVPNGNIVYSEPPTLALTPVSNPNVEIATDTATWVVKLCNTSQRGNAGITWFGVEPNPSVQNFRVIAMRDITNNANQFSLPIRTYGSNSRNAFAYANPLTVATPDKTLDDICNVLEIKALVKDCGITNLDINAGWNCIRPTDTAWSPLNYLPCVDLTIPAQVSIEAPFLDAQFINQSLDKPGVCDSTVYEIILRNTDLGRVFDVRTQIQLPILGATFIPSGVQVAYPPSAPYRNATGVPRVVGMNQRGRIYQFDDFSALNPFLHQNGLAGFDPSRPNDSNEVKIKFSFSNSCDFRSGSLIYYSFLGKTACGTPSNNERGESLPITIQGADLNSPKLYSVSSSDQNKFVPGGVSTLEISFTNLTTTLSDANDKVSVRLPSGIRYRPNSSVGVQPPTWTVQEPRSTIIGEFEVLTWYQPIGLGLNQTATLRFDVQTPDTLTCNGDLREMGISTMAEKELVCQTDNSVCRVDIITTSNGEQFDSIPLSIDSIRVISSPNHVLGTINATRGQVIEITAIGGTSYRWIDLLDNSVIGTSQMISITASRAEMNIRVEAVTGACLRPSTLRILTAQDTAPPRIAVRDTTVGCRDTFPLLRPIVTDDFDPNPVLSYTDSLIRFNACTEFLVRTWTARDASGKIMQAIQRLTRTDRTAPTITPVNPILVSRNFRSGDTLTVSCDSLPIFRLEDMAYSDDCDADLSRRFVDVAVQEGNCRRDGFIVLMECDWRATDDCGNTALFKIFIKIKDENFPTLVQVPQNITVNTPADIPNIPSDVFGRDVCDDEVSIQFTESQQDTVVLRTWTATDDCGHATTATQRITIRNGRVTNSRDTLPPQYAARLARLQNTRNGDTLNIDTCQFSLKITDLAVSDNRDAQPRIQLDSTVLIGSCQTQGYLYFKTYRWTATDSTGNSATFLIYLKITDNRPPVLQGVPSNITLSANEPLPAMPDVTATDNCSTPTVLPTTSQRASGNDTIYTRTWTATDACGNTASGWQFITRQGISNSVRDTLPPQYAARLAMLQGRNNGDTLNMEACDYFIVQTDLSVNDNMDRNPIVHLDSTVRIGDCATEGFMLFKIYRWTARDSAGNTAQFVICLKLVDRTPPIFSGVPSDTLISANAPFPIEPRVLATDNCSVPQIETRVSQLVVAGDTIYTRVWFGRDACGNTASARQSITRRGTIPGDTLAPVFAPQHVLLLLAENGDTIPSNNCDESFVADDVLVIDNTDPNPVIVFDSTTVNGNCQQDGFVQFKVYRWQATDSTGNRSTFTVYLKIEDNTPPTLVGVPADITIQATDPVPPATVTAIDDCSAAATVSTNKVIAFNGNDTIYIRSWVAVDNCGNEAIQRQTVYKRTGNVNSNSIVGGSTQLTYSLNLGNRDTICLKRSNPNGTNYSIRNLCPDSLGRAVSFTILRGDTCIALQANSEGNGKICLQICDSTGVCDTTIVGISARVQRIVRPIAVHDVTQTKRNKGLEIPVMQNDTLTGTLKSFKVMAQPKNGLATAREKAADRFIAYQPNLDFCSSRQGDVFVYEICNELGCATAQVTVMVQCDSLIIYNAFSPNEDGKNDVFTIGGLENFPNTQVAVYNRWGNQVFFSKDYKNDWRGTYQNTTLPDGTYFYHIVLETGETRTGYLMIQR